MNTFKMWAKFTVVMPMPGESSEARTILINPASVIAIEHFTDRDGHVTCYLTLTSGTYNRVEGTMDEVTEELDAAAERLAENMLEALQKAGRLPE